MDRVELTIACTLGSEALAKRGAEWEALFADALSSVERRDDALVLSFAREDPRLDALVRAERECCSFLELTVEGGTVVSIAAPRGGGETLDLFEELAEKTLQR